MSETFADDRSEKEQFPVFHRQSVRSGRAAEGTRMISLLIPCYNECNVLRLTYERIIEAAADWNESIEILFVDDGSTDETWSVVEWLANRDPRVRGVRLSRNFGHQAAIGAGLEHVRGDAVVVLDADLQDPPELIAQMLQRWRDGFEIVVAQRNCRLGEPVFKKIAGNLYYRLLDRINEVNIPRDSGDFVLMDASVVRMLVNLKEHAVFWRGLRCWTGCRQTAVHFDRPPRAHGESKYTVAKLTHLALAGLLSFSKVPLRLPIYIGGATLGGTLLAATVTAAAAVIRPAGEWMVSPAVLVTLFVSAVQLLCLGVVGEYMNRIYDEVRDRPRWIVRSIIGEAANESASDRFERRAA